MRNEMPLNETERQTLYALAMKTCSAMEKIYGEKTYSYYGNTVTKDGKIFNAKGKELIISARGTVMIRVDGKSISIRLVESYTKP